MKTTFSYRVHFLLATLLFGVPACDGNVLYEQDADVCSNPEFADFEERPFSITLPDDIKWDGKGDETNFDFELGIIYLAAPSEGGDDDAIGTLTLLFEDPIASSASGRTACSGIITSAHLSTSDVRRGTGPELNAKLYGLVQEHEGVCEKTGFNAGIELGPGSVEFFYVSRNSADGWFCLFVEEISPGSGEPILIAGSFAIRN